MIMEIMRSLFALLVLTWSDSSSFTVCRMVLGRNPQDGALVSHRIAVTVSKHYAIVPYYFHSTLFPAIPENVCTKPTLPAGMMIYPDKTEYKVRSDIMLACSESGMSPSGRLSYTCGKSLVWEPSIPKDIHCKIGTFTRFTKSGDFIYFINFL